LSSQIHMDQSALRKNMTAEDATCHLVNIIEEASLRTFKEQISQIPWTNRRKSKDPCCKTFQKISQSKELTITRFYNLQRSSPEHKAKGGSTRRKVFPKQLQGLSLLGQNLKREKG